MPLHALLFNFTEWRFALKQTIEKAYDFFFGEVSSEVVKIVAWEIYSCL